MTDDFDIIRNTTNAFSINVPDDFNEPAGNGFVRIMVDDISVVVTPQLTTSPPIALALTSPQIVFSPTTELVGSTVVPTLYDYSTDCVIVQGRTDSFSPIGTGLWLGTERTGGVVIGNYKVWIPFVVSDTPPITQGKQIASAILTIMAIHTSDPSNITSLKFGCEKTGNPIAPVNYNDLNARVMTAAFTAVDYVEGWVTGTAYTFDITTAVQEVFNLSTWADGNVLAVMIMHGAIFTDGYRYCASYSHPTYDKPKLDITY
jgi:hypothetical protein